ncbi:MAG TPA: fructose-6-phosphate aldolase [Veillonellaceae bacterium]|jgi:transaldolase|nr:fructose-6-phosphate aldolase [Veillonellaceae bacterium]
MKFFIDTANVEEIRKAYDMGFISGVTTNPSLIAREGRDFHQVVREISSFVNGPISAEVIAEEADGMVGEAEELVKIGPHIVIKIPMTPEGLKAVSRLHKKGIHTNVTLVFSANQALLAARAGASYVSPFVGRIDDIGWDGVELVRDIADIFSIHQISTEIIAASIRKPQHIEQCALAGAHIATVPYQVLMDAMKHPLTDAGLARFKADWAKAGKTV